MREEVITLGGGCFWCTEAVYEQVQGVLSVQSGYCNGQTVQPSYEQVCEGRTGHAEVVRVRFDADQVSLRELLEIFFVIHDPTTLNRQGNDIGSSYRSAIFFADDVQKQAAEQMIDKVNQSGAWKRPVVTTLEPLGTFWVAEDYHQDYLQKLPNGYTCHFIRPVPSFLDKAG